LPQKNEKGKNFLTSIYYLRLLFVFGADFQPSAKPLPFLAPTVSTAPLKWAYKKDGKL
jgi:hypothetical protein